MIVKLNRNRVIKFTTNNSGNNTNNKTVEEELEKSMKWKKYVFIPLKFVVVFQTIVSIQKCTQN